MRFNPFRVGPHLTVTQGSGFATTLGYTLATLSGLPIKSNAEVCLRIELETGLTRETIELIQPRTKLSFMPDQNQKTRPSGGGPDAPAPGGGPSAPKVDRPNVDDLLKRMRKVDPDQAKRYRQRTGQ